MVIENTLCRNCGTEYQSTGTDECPECGTEKLDCSHEYMDDRRVKGSKQEQEVDLVRQCNKCGKVVGRDRNRQG